MKHVVILSILSVLVVGALLAFLLYKPTHIPTPAEKARQRLEFLEANNASPEDQCAAARAVASAYADAMDARNYREAQLNARVTCEYASTARMMKL